jgi:hypothetical protein
MTILLCNDLIFVSTTKGNNMKTYTFNTDTVGIQKRQIELVDFVHSMDMSVIDFATGRENELNVNGKLIQFHVAFNGADFSDEYSVIYLEKSISLWN